ncbi:Lrp/AsnC family transcriptional regulator [Sphingomonadales bacterium 56]|uniref:Lrp/AsnC family transcriptional regulator n=1 Tax=Sphingobium agri TaxID=2933566 RepID=A0ABT0DSB5_9SPHN|nr:MULTISPECIES: Lrp/AsnC family transcriptional regulator [Sphingomonadaceae]MBY2930559.1 Lrp/AsnC family transcriptional regulator [Sphingomonadales bacterium 56]MBY2960605.1 Lrp/AsnC family transcriptional regulator [Sphingomonadales bacterium 58]MCK0530015.1 Lrp/AsnC family transcriptional regulator [Sphingobium agri]CAD7341536.1 Regulatory protein AsnC [Sphingobium sp. S8]CAD7341545.1 Regulatory protein AsnC [Sphingobium sp. S6]
MTGKADWARLDKLDQGIVEKLARDARISNRAIAAELGVTEGTIRTRVKRLQNEGLIQFTVVTDFRMAGSPNLCMMGIDADPSQVSELARSLSDLEEITCVIVLLGRYSLLAMGLFTNIEQLNDLVTERIRPMPGVQRVETSVSVHNLKYEAGIAKITRDVVAG